MSKYIFTSERVGFRPLTQDDFPFVRKMDTDPECLKYINHGNAKTAEQTQWAIDNFIQLYEKEGFCFWLCELIESGEAIGWCGLKYIEESTDIEVGYRFLPQYWGKGYASECAKRSVDYGFLVLELEVVHGRVSEDNVASMKVLEKLGMVFEADTIFKDIPCKKYVLERTVEAP